MLKIPQTGDMRNEKVKEISIKMESDTQYQKEPVEISGT